MLGTFPAAPRWPHRECRECVIVRGGTRESLSRRGRGHLLCYGREQGGSPYRVVNKPLRADYDTNELAFAHICEVQYERINTHLVFSRTRYLW